jgi:inhibitor of KinA sporulation pathway (predicted exonuclease)
LINANCSKVVKVTQTNSKTNIKPAFEEQQNNTKMLDRVVVLDYEACCDAKQTYYEIIEFPSVLVNLQTLQVEDEFQQFVKPTVYPELNEICIKITGITQRDVDGGVKLDETLTRYATWLEKNKLTENGVKVGNWTYVTCGDWDLIKALPTECTRKNLTYPECMREWINIKREFAIEYKGAVYPDDEGKKRFKHKKEMGMAGMLKHLKLELKGHHHSGIDDCRNIAQIVVAMAQDGKTKSFSQPNGRI